MDSQRSPENTTDMESRRSPENTSDTESRRSPVSPDMTALDIESRRQPENISDMESRSSVRNKRDMESRCSIENTTDMEPRRSPVSTDMESWHSPENTYDMESRRSLENTRDMESRHSPESTPETESRRSSGSPDMESKRSPENTPDLESISSPENTSDIDSQSSPGHIPSAEFRRSAKNITTDESRLFTDNISAMELPENKADPHSVRSLEDLSTLEFRNSNEKNQCLDAEESGSTKTVRPTESTGLLQETPILVYAGATENIRATKSGMLLENILTVDDWCSSGNLTTIESGSTFQIIPCVERTDTRGNTADAESENASGNSPETFITVETGGPLENLPNTDSANSPEQEHISATESESSPENNTASEPAISSGNIPEIEREGSTESINLMESASGSKEVNLSMESIPSPENTEQFLLGSDEILTPLKCPIFRANLGGASVTECGHCFCTHCVDQRKGSLYKTCNICRKTISSHHLKEIDKGSESIVRARDETIEELREKEAEVTQKVHDLQEELQNNEQRGQQLNSELTETKMEVSCLQETILKLQMFETQCIEQDRQLQVFQENILPEKENTISELLSGVAQISDALNDKENEVECLNGQIQNLQQYVQLCYDQNDQLNHYRENIVPEKDNTISELRSLVEKLNGEYTTLKRITMPVRQLEALPDTNLGRAIQQLQHFYDRDYRSRYDLTDKIEALLQTRLECVMNELCQEQEIGDQVALVITTYTSMVQENSNLHRSLRTKQDEIQHLKTELRQTKLTKRHNEQRLRYKTEE